MNVFSQNPDFQKREIQVSVSDPGSRVFAIDIVAHRLGWNLTFTKGPVAGFKPETAGWLSPEAVIEGLSHFLVQHTRVTEEKDVTERIEDLLDNAPSAMSEEHEADVLKVAEQEIADLHEKNEALTQQCKDLLAVVESLKVPVAPDPTVPAVDPGGPGGE